jgi:hypothetical protein
MGDRYGYQNTRFDLEELKAFIDEVVDKRLEERIGDPDIGLEIKTELIEKIRKSRRNKVKIPAKDVANKIGLWW